MQKFQLNCATIVPRIIVLGSWFMKKILGIIVLILLLCGNTYAKEKKIGNGLSINIPEGYHYFELTLKQIITRFPSLDINDFQIEGFDLGIGIDAKLVVLSNEKKNN